MTIRIGAVGYATEQGLGYLMKSFYDAGVVDDVMIFRHNKRPTHKEWYPRGTIELVDRPFNGSVVDKFVRSVQVMLFFETPFDWHFIPYCQHRGVKTVLMPMYEWLPVNIPSRPDMMLCPSVLDLDYFKGKFHSVFVPVPVDPSRWKLRKKALRFLHNAGNIGHREHKGTRQLVAAIPLVKNPDFRITIRGQDVRALQSILGNYPAVTTDPRVTIQYGAQPHEKLFDDHDVYIAPEKFNGLSLPLQEARAAGLLVMTTNRYPANTWLPPEGLIRVAWFERAKIAGPYYEFDEAIVQPEDIAATIDEWYGRDIEQISLSGGQWAKEHSWEALKGRYLEVLRGLCG